jgi:hypothetical protein
VSWRCCSGLALEDEDIAFDHFFQTSFCFTAILLVLPSTTPPLTHVHTHHHAAPANLYSEGSWTRTATLQLDLRRSRTKPGAHASVLNCDCNPIEDQLWQQLGLAPRLKPDLHILTGTAAMPAEFKLSNRRLALRLEWKRRRDDR